MRTFRKRRAGLSATAGLSCCCRRRQERKGKERYKKSQSRYISRNRREAPSERILTKFRTSRDMADVIIRAKFYVEKLRGYRYTEVQTLVSPIETAGHPYNSAALLRSLL